MLEKILWWKLSTTGSGVPQSPTNQSTRKSMERRSSVFASIRRKIRWWWSASHRWKHLIRPKMHTLDLMVSLDFELVCTAEIFGIQSTNIKTSSTKKSPKNQRKSSSFSQSATTERRRRFAFFVMEMKRNRQMFLKSWKEIVCTRPSFLDTKMIFCFQRFVSMLRII